MGVAQKEAPGSPWVLNVWFVFGGPPVFGSFSSDNNNAGTTAMFEGRDAQDWWVSFGVLLPIQKERPGLRQSKWMANWCP